MWVAQGTSIQMTEGDFGIALPITISGITMAANDSVKISIMRFIDGVSIIEKTFASITNNTVNLELTAADSAKFKVGSYSYRLDWYRDNAFMCNIIPSGKFTVVNKA